MLQLLLRITVLPKNTAQASAFVNTPLLSRVVYGYVI